MTKIVINHSDIDSAYTLDIKSIFNDILTCEIQINKTVESIAGLTLLPVNPANCASDLLMWLTQRNKISIDANKIYIYGYLSNDLSQDNSQCSTLFLRAVELFQSYQTAILPLEEALAFLDEEKWKSFVDEIPQLVEWNRFYLGFRRHKNRRGSNEVNALISELQVLIDHAGKMDGNLVRTMKFDSVIDSSGNQHLLTQSTFSELYSSKDALIRSNTNRNYQNTRYQHRVSTTDTLYQYMRLKVIEAKSKNYSSNLEMAFDLSNINQNVFFQTLEACERHNALWDRFWKARRNALGLQKYSSNDIGLMLDTGVAEIPYEQAVEWIVESVRPLGADYANQLRHGLTDDRWIDVFPRQGKSSSSYFATTQGCKPFVIVNYKKDFTSLSTLAHESGHAMHCFYTFASQPHQYASFGMTVAETAANVHQALLFSFLRKNSIDSNIQRAALDAEMRVSRRYLMQMPLNARFEHELYSRLWNGEGFEADTICSRYLELAKATNGPSLELTDSDAVDWMDEPVLWQHYYALQYTFGIAGAQAIAERLLSGEPGAVEGYHQLLRAGCSLDEFEILAMAGVKFDNSSTIDKAFQRVERLVGELEALV